MAERRPRSMYFLGIGGLSAAPHSPPADSNRKSCGKNAAALDNAIEKYYLRFHDRSDAG